VYFVFHSSRFLSSSSARYIFPQAAATPVTGKKLFLLAPVGEMR